MNITERDIFNFVFERSALPPETIEFIESTNTYREEIAFYESLKKSFNDTLSGDLKRKLSNRIPAYKHERVIELFPTRIENGRKKNVVRFAADSPKTLPKISADTYIDANSEYMIRIIKEREITKLFIFAVSGEDLKDFKIVLHPCGTEYHCQDNSNPLEVGNGHPIEKINLIFN